MSETDEARTGVTEFQARQMLEKAEWAVSQFVTYERAEVLRIAEAAANAAEARADEFGKWAVRETGFGVAEHKALKNRLCSRGLFDYYRDENYTEYRIDAPRKIVEVPKPAGVVFALIPSTNPVSTVFYKIMLALLTRNAIVMSPHPAAKECCVEAALTMARAAEEAGAPDGVIQVVREPNVPLIEAIMASPKTNVILATGGVAMVRAAYSSGNPALGVGPGNGPAYVDVSADLAGAAKQITDSKAFDNSVLCTNESAVIAHADIAERLKKEMEKQGCYLCSEHERDALEQALFPGGRFNVGLLGKDAAIIAREAGIRVSQKTRVLLVPLERIGDDYPLSREKLCPVLGFYAAPSLEAGINACKAMVRHSGGGHSAAVHAQDPDVVLRFGAEMPVLRLAVNAPNSTGSAGFETHLAPTMTIGTGFYGRSSVGENVRPDHLIQWVRIAYNKDDKVPFPSFDGLELHRKRISTADLPDTRYAGYAGSLPHRAGTHPQPTTSVTHGGHGPAHADNAADADLRAEIRRIIAEELRAFGQENARP